MTLPCSTVCNDEQIEKLSKIKGSKYKMAEAFVSHIGDLKVFLDLNHRKLHEKLITQRGNIHCTFYAPPTTTETICG